MISQNRIFLLVTGDFNGINSSWWKNDCVTKDGTEIESLTCSCRLSQLISNPTHILSNSSSCIDLAPANQPYFIIDSGVRPSFHPNCHQQIVYSKLNLKIEYPPLYKRLVWDYKNEDSQSINKAIEMFNWAKLFHNKNIHDQVKHFNEAVVNIVYNYIPNKCITCNGKDISLLNDPIKGLINQKKYLISTSRKEDLILFKKTCKPLHRI